MSLNNEVLKCIHERRSTRRFTDEQISPEQLDTLLDAAIWAPSAVNSQTWLFTAVQKKDVLLQLNELVREGFQHCIPENDADKHLRALREHARKESYNFYYEAPTLIIASNRLNYNNAMADCAVALQNIFLAAHSIGLGSCYINQLHRLQNYAPLHDFLTTLGIPSEYTICGSAAIGHILKASSPLARKPNTIAIIR
jgi:nitroreductase